jgi:uncharacterized membrane protein
MTQQGSPRTDQAWAWVEREKRIDRFIRRVSIAAWSVTFLIVLGFAVLTGMQVVEMVRLTAGANLPFAVVTASAMPLIIVLGFLSVLIATLSTIAIFLRLRTSSLAEIQLRLAALEEMISDKDKS